MDHRAGVIEAMEPAGVDLASGTVRADQAIFTSIRGPMGEGYRIVAMSPGISSEERAEITRRSPSHGSLSSDDPGAVGLMSYPLAGSERQCVACSRYAGKEHTARGGQRVHTHLVLLHPAAFLQFGNDPVQVKSALLQVIGPMPNVKPSPCLDEIVLPIPMRDDGRSCIPEDAGEMGRACHMAELLYCGTDAVVIGAAWPLETLGYGVSILPLSARAGLAASAGLHYAPSRQMRLTCIEQGSQELTRTVQGRDTHVVELLPTADATPTLAGWCAWARERWQAKQFSAFTQLAAMIDETASVDVLTRVVEICRDMNMIACAGKDALEAMVAHYADVQHASGIELRLGRQLLSAAVRRCAELHEQESKAETAAS